MLLQGIEGINMEQFITIKKNMNMGTELSLYHWMPKIHAHDPRRRILILALSEEDSISAPQLHKLGSSESSVRSINMLLHNILRNLLKYQAAPPNFLQIKMEGICLLSV